LSFHNYKEQKKDLTTKETKQAKQAKPTKQAKQAKPKKPKKRKFFSALKLNKKKPNHVQRQLDEYCRDPHRCRQASTLHSH
jgi:hypothetical protein